MAWYMAGHKVCVFNGDGQYVRDIGRGQGKDDGMFESPTAVAVDGRLLVA